MRKVVIPLVVVTVAVCGIGGVVLQSRMKAAAKVEVKSAKVEVADLIQQVVESGTIDAVKTVEVKSQVTGRVAKLLVEEGSVVQPGQLIAVIDPEETRFRVEQNAAQLQGAQSAADRTAVEIEQRRLSTRAALKQAEVRVKQLEMEMHTQPTLTRAAVRMAETSLNAVRQDQDRLLQSVHPQQRTATEREISEAKANYENAVLEFERRQELAKKGYVAGRTVDDGRLSLDLAKARYEAAKENASRLDAQLRAEAKKVAEQVLQAEAELSRARANGIQDEMKRQEYLSALADRDRARAALQDPLILAKQRDQNLATVRQLQSVLRDSQRQLGETEIRAPIGGIVTKKLLQVGELCTGLSSFGSGSTIVEIEDRKAMRVKLDMNEIDMAKLRVGMDSDIDVDAIPGTAYKGTVQKIAPASKEAANGQPASADAVVRYEVEILIKNPDSTLRSGMSARCTVVTMEKKGVPSLPIEYVVREGKKTFVELPNPAKAESGKQPAPIRKEIVTGAKTGSRIEILTGLKAGDSVLRPKFNGPERMGMMEVSNER